MSIQLLQGDCLEILPTLDPESVHAVITDPPYHLTTGKKGGTGEASLNLKSPAGRSRISTGFMNQSWDGGDIAMRPETWAEVLRVMKPGAHLLAFGGTRTVHRMACAIEDAGFEIRNQIMWIFGSGFPHGVDIGKAIRKKYGDDVAEPWIGWHSEPKPAHEPIVVARKPMVGTLIKNTLQHGTGGLNIDACRVPINPEIDDPRLGGKGEWSTVGMAKNVYGEFAGTNSGSSELGRFPANIIHDGSEVVRKAFPEAPGASAPVLGTEGSTTGDNGIFGHYNRVASMPIRQDVDKSAARFFYCAKSPASERQGSAHPTIKPVALMRYLCKLITPPGGTILDLFAGSGTTGQAAVEEGFNNVILIEREAEYCQDIRNRLNMYLDM